MLNVNSRIDDIRTGSRSCTLIILVRCLALGAMRDTGQTPGDILLRDDIVDGEDGVLFNVVDLFLSPSPSEPFLSFSFRRDEKKKYLG